MVWYIFLLFGFLSRAEQPLRVAVVDSPPFSIHDSKGAPRGASVEFVRAIIETAKVQAEEIQVPFRRLEEISNTMNALIPHVTRTKDREDKFRWVSKTFEDKYCFATLKSQTPVSKLEQAKGLKAIGVNSGGATEKFLQKQGFNNLDTSDSHQASVRKLLLGKVDAWFSSSAIAFYAVKEQNADPDSVVCTGEFEKLNYWVAASLKMPDDTFTLLQSAAKTVAGKGDLSRFLNTMKSAP